MVTSGIDWDQGQHDIAIQVIGSSLQATYTADWAMPGTLFHETMSPMANTSGRPGRVQSGSAGTRPARSVSTPVARASIPTAARQVGRLLQCDVRVEPVHAKLHVGRLLGNGGLGVGCVCVGSLVGRGDLPCLLTRQYASDE
jgi:hypothetical protein